MCLHGSIELSESQHLLHLQACSHLPGGTLPSAPGADSFSDLASPWKLRHPLLGPRVCPPTTPVEDKPSCFLKELQYKAHFFQPLGVESQIPKETGLLSVRGLQSYLQPPCDLYYHQPMQADFLKQFLWVRQRWHSGKEFARRCRGCRFNP